MPSTKVEIANSTKRRSFVGGSDARIIMGQGEKALIRLWQEKRGEVGPEDLYVVAGTGAVYEARLYALISRVSS